MASTYTTNLGIEKIQTGQQAGQWGDTTNTNFDIIDQAVNGIATVTLTSAGTSGSPNDIPITDGAESDGRNKFIRLYSASDLGGTVYVRITPSDAEKIVHIRNDLNTQNAVIFQGNYDAGRSIGVTNGRDVLLKFDGGGDGAATVADVNNDLGVTKITAATADISTADINGGNIDGTVIGGTTAAAGTFTTFTSTGIDDNAASTAITIDASQQIGIGTASPANLVDIVSSDTTPTLRIQSTNGTATTPTIKLDGSSDGTIKMQSGGLGGLTIQRDGGAALLFKNSASEIDVTGTFTTFTSTGIDDNATSTAITISSSEQVGIGTASPSADLHVYEAASLGTAAANTRIEAENTTYSSATLVITNNDDTITLSCDNGNSPSGKIGAYVRLQGLPTSDPSVAGQVWNDSGTLKISAG
jgi:hypothetical protein